MAQSVEVPEKSRVMTGQDRKLLARFTESFPFETVSKRIKQLFVGDKSGAAFAFLAEQMSLYDKTNSAVKKFFIDCDAVPHSPTGLKVENHCHQGMVGYNKDEFIEKLHLSEKQKRGMATKGSDLRNEFVGVKVANANVLDWLLANPDQIPKSVKGAIFFWGTIYSDSGGRLFVRYLVWRDDKWTSQTLWLADYLSENYPALLVS